MLFAKADGALHEGLHTMMVADDNFKYHVVSIETKIHQVNSLALSRRQKRIGLPVNVMYSWSNATGVSRVVVLNVT